MNLVLILIYICVCVRERERALARAICMLLFLVDLAYDHKMTKEEQVIKSIYYKSIQAKMAYM